MRRHLLYHLMPIRGNGIWQLNLDRLMGRLDLFDGVRSIAIVTSPRCDQPDVVKEAMGAARIDNWIVLPNDPGLREVVTWAPLWDTVRSQADDDAVFYAQGKGVTHPCNRGVTCHRWGRLMYAANLDYWPVVAELLKRHPVVGALKKIGPAFPGSRSAWHFTGSFFWARLGAVRHLLGQIDRKWWGNESWPGLHFSPNEAGLLGGVQGAATHMDAYRMKRWEQIESEFQAWTKEHIGAVSRV